MKTWQLSERVSTALWLACLAITLNISGVLSRIDNVIYDATQKHTPRIIPQDVVVVAIDEQSLTSLGRWPWSRHLHGQLIDRLHADGAKVIGYDVMFVEPQMDDPLADRSLAEAIGRAGNVVLPVVIEPVRRNGLLIEALPLPVIASKAAAMGRVHAELDADAIARSISLWEGLGQPIWPHFVQAVLSVAGQLPAQFPTHMPVQAVGQEQRLVKYDQRYINFSTAAHHLPSLSFEQVLRGHFQPGTFKDKLVLVGSTATGMADSLPTPVSGFQQPMPGVEFLANALISMRQESLVSLASVWASSAVACLLAILPMAWLPRTGNRVGAILTGVAAVLVLGVGMALPVVFQVWLPVSAGLLGLLVAYPFWAWRKIESAGQFLDAELLRLRNELASVQSASVPEDELHRIKEPDHFQKRIIQVRQATAHLQQLDQAQRETLAFVSHDIRVPLASAAAQIREDLGEHHAAYLQLNRALAWTEDYLQTSRAQMLRKEDFADMDLVAMLHQVADEIYPLAKSKGLRLLIDLPFDPVWIQGNFDTLYRAVVNLMVNALKFSPQEGEVELSAQLQGTQMHIAITDHGPGIAHSDIDRLFKRFSRLEQAEYNFHQGVGLGLYFVQTTVQKHRGDVQVDSVKGCTTFRIVLPL